ncbi:MAG: endonuclease/exonuclease/phosphatase family protein [Anaerolineae bacterium]
MPFYFPLRWNFNAEDSQRTANRLLTLRQQIRDEIPPRTVEDTLLLATWNIRDFDSNKFGHGPRLKESFFYIAEIIAAFDLVALQEVNEDLSALKTVMRILGSDWDYIATDKTAGRAGNQERMVFVYDTRKVRFQNIAGEIVLPMSQLVEGEKQFARTPFLVSFQSGWFRFMLCTVHVYYGGTSGEKLARRIEEIDTIANVLSHRADDESANYVILGDFNIVSPEHQTMQALKKHDFIVPDGLSNVPSNMRLDKHYDQIAFKARAGQVQFGGRAGVFNLYRSVFREEDKGMYLERMSNVDELELGEDGRPRDTENNTNYYLNTWRTFQMSDHLPMWVELRIDFSEQYLRNLVTPSFGPPSVHPLSFSMPELDD